MAAANPNQNKRAGVGYLGMFKILGHELHWFRIACRTQLNTTPDSIRISNDGIFAWNRIGWIPRNRVSTALVKILATSLRVLWGFTRFSWFLLGWLEEGNGGTFTLIVRIFFRKCTWKCTHSVWINFYESLA